MDNINDSQLEEFLEVSDLINEALEIQEEVNKEMLEEKAEKEVKENNHAGN